KNFFGNIKINIAKTGRKFPFLCAFFLLLFTLSSCEDTGCVLPYQFEQEEAPTVTVEANPPLSTGSAQYYIHETGGQKALWKEIFYVTNGRPFVIHISGSWTSWYGDNNAVSVPLENKCNLMTQNTGSTALGIDGEFALADDYQDITTEQALHPNIQVPCWYEGGTGLYLGLFGRTGNRTPEVVFHLQTDNKICVSPRQEVDTNGDNVVDDCVYSYTNLETGNIETLTDQWVWEYKSENDPIWGGPPPVNEVIKMVILDNFYRDNVGEYRITFLDGVRGYSDEDLGVFSSVIKIIEDLTFGYVDENHFYKPGFVEILYNQFLIDSYFGILIKLALTLAIAFLGVGTLLGIIDLTQKELMIRIIKIGFVLWFTTDTAWFFFNNYVVNLFIGGTNFIVQFISSVVIEMFPETSSLFGYVQDSRSLASNFNFIDNVINFLFSSNTSSKIWGLFFATWTGIIYIVFIYVLILFFIIVTIFAAQTYVFYLLQMGVVLALGPILIAFVLFEKTKHIFLNWLSYLLGRSFEIIILFFSLYLMVGVIVNRFMDLLSYSVCTKPLIEAAWIETLNLNVYVLKAQGYGGFMQWMMSLLIVFCFITIMFLLIKISSMLGTKLASIGSVGDPAALHEGMDMSEIIKSTLGDMVGLTKSGGGYINKLPGKIMGDKSVTFGGMAKRAGKTKTAKVIGGVLGAGVAIAAAPVVGGIAVGAGLTAFGAYKGARKGVRSLGEKTGFSDKDDRTSKEKDFDNIIAREGAKAREENKQGKDLESVVRRAALQETSRGKDRELMIQRLNKTFGTEKAGAEKTRTKAKEDRIKAKETVARTKEAIAKEKETIAETREAIAQEKEVMARAKEADASATKARRDIIKAREARAEADRAITEAREARVEADRARVEADRARTEKIKREIEERGSERFVKSREEQLEQVKEIAEIMTKLQVLEQTERERGELGTEDKRRRKELEKELDSSLRSFVSFETDIGKEASIKELTKVGIAEFDQFKHELEMFGEIKATGDSETKRQKQMRKMKELQEKADKYKEKMEEYLKGQVVAEAQ
ncbi:type IV secretion system protein, partial [Pseudomonadota bacterium]